MSGRDGLTPSPLEGEGWGEGYSPYAANITMHNTSPSTARPLPLPRQSGLPSGGGGKIARRPWFGGNYCRGIVGLNRYAITFDDGPLPGATDIILDHLTAANAKAAFFVIGRHAERWPDLIRRMHAEGHIVGNHTWDHSRWGMWRAPWYWRKQIDRTDDVIERLIGRRPAMFRPPLGVRTPVNKWVIRQTGHACVLWTRRSLDGVRTTTEKIEKRLLATAADGDVLLLHDGREPVSKRDPQPTVDAVPRLIEAFAKRGLVPAALDELLGVPAYK